MRENRSYSSKIRKHFYESFRDKRGITGPVVSIFVVILVVSLLAGLTFLFVTTLKTNVVDTTKTTSTQYMEGGVWINASGYTIGVDGNTTTGSERGFEVVTVLAITNATGETITSSNYTVSDGVLSNTTSSTIVNTSNLDINYTYSSVAGSEAAAYDAVNDTEDAGTTIVDYLPLVFLSLIFGIILTLVLRIILPYINLGQRFEGF